MTHCSGCGGEFDAEGLTRHERDGIVHVHCPECGHRLGDWNRQAGHSNETPPQE